MTFDQFGGKPRKQSLSVTGTDSPVYLDSIVFDPLAEEPVIRFVPIPIAAEQITRCVKVVGAKHGAHRFVDRVEILIK